MDILALLHQNEIIVCDSIFKLQIYLKMSTSVPYSQAKRTPLSGSFVKLIKFLSSSENVIV